MFLNFEMNNKIFSNLSLLSSVFMIIPLAAYSASPDSGPVNSVFESMLNLLNVLTQIGIVTAFVVFGWGIVRLITAANNPAVLKQAKGILWWGIIGLFVLASLFGIVSFIKIYIGIPDNVIINIPNFSR